MIPPLSTAPENRRSARPFYNSMRTTFFPFLIGAALYGFFGSHACAGAVEMGAVPGDLPPAPESRILDPARVFTFEPEISDRLSKVLRAALATDGIDAYVTAYSFLLDETVADRAIRLEERWITQPKGLVVAYVRGGDQISFAASAGFEDFLPRNDLDELFLAAATGVKDIENPAERITVATERFLQSIAERLHTVEETRSFFRRDTVLLALIALVFAGLIARIGSHFFATDRQPRETRRFPSVKVARRFGAGHGGGVMAESSFPAAPPSTQPSSPPQS